MRFEWLIIDGYNVLHTQPQLVALMRSDMEQARHQLVRQIEAATLAMADQVTLVFDGKNAVEMKVLVAHASRWYMPQKNFLQMA